MAVVEGEAGLIALSARLQAAGAVAIRAEMNKALKAAVVPVVASIQREAAADFPKKGGFAGFMARRKPRRVVRTTGRQTWIRVSYTGKGRYADQGEWLHPVFGRHMSPKPNADWVGQDYGPTHDYYQRGGEAARPQAEALMNAVLVEIDRQVQKAGL